MADEFTEQGGAATMDPGPVARWLTSRLMSRLFSPERVDRRRTAAEKQRVKHRAPHRVDYFHQVDDGYSHLAAQVLAPLADRYDIELCCHLVEGPRGNNVAEPDLLLQLSRDDAFHVAPEYGLQFPQHPGAPVASLVQQASAILTALDNKGFIASAAAVGQALWSRDASTLESLAQSLGRASAEQTASALAAGNRLRSKLKHYSGAMFYYGGEWYWGVDRLYHLENRLAALGVDRLAGQAMIIPRPSVEPGDYKDSATLTLEMYVSLRSPYTAIVFDRAVRLARDTGVNLDVRPVLPMVMRGVPATREKGFYIFMDAAREAREAGIPYGNFYDPIGDPARRCYSLYAWAGEQEKATELISSFLAHAFVRGVNTNNDRGLRKVVERAGLNWSDAQQYLGVSGWEATLEQNRLAMYETGLWGVPSFRLLDESGQQLLALWGQDRLWLFAREIQRQLQKR